MNQARLDPSSGEIYHCSLPILRVIMIELTLRFRPLCPSAFPQLLDSLWMTPHPTLAWRKAFSHKASSLFLVIVGMQKEMQLVSSESLQPEQIRLPFVGTT